MAHLRIEIDLDGDAFATPDASCAEIARLLREGARRFEEDATNFGLVDSNGLRCGRIRLLAGNYDKEEPI